jgi:CSLREA domain-containing protein
MLGTTASKVMWVEWARTLALCVLALLVTVSIGVLVGAKPAHATEFRVNSFDDAGDFPLGDDHCSTDASPGGAGGFCTLRAAIEEANTDAQSDTITISNGVSGNITLTLGQLTITHDLSIQGPGARTLTVSGNDVSRVFFIDAGDNPTIDVNIKGIKISEGIADLGGGIYNRDTLTLTKSTVSGNAATAVSGDTASGQGGGIFNSGTLTLRNTTVNGNAADRNGGGIDNIGTLTLTNSTVSNNTATNNTPYTFDGGGGILTNFKATLKNSTISGNTANNGGGIYHLNGDTNIATTIVAGNSASLTSPDIKEQTLGEITSQGFNFIGDVSG